MPRDVIARAQTPIAEPDPVNVPSCLSDVDVKLLVHTVLHDITLGSVSVSHWAVKAQRQPARRAS